MIPRLWYWSDGARGTAGRPLLDVLRAACAGGVGGVVLREFDLAPSQLASLVSALTPERQKGLLLLVSRRVDLCLALDLDGVHLAADALPVPETRRLLGPGRLVGFSAHEGGEARAVAAQGADYVALSPIYATGSKPGLAGRGLTWLRTALEDQTVPCLGLGGVTPERAREIVRAGAWGVAAVSAIGAAPDVRAAARAFRRRLDEEIR